MALSDEERAALLKTTEDFMATIGQKAREHKIKPHMLVRMFGLYTRHVVDNLVENGVPREQATMEAFELFAQGLGMKVEVGEAGPMQ